MTAEHDLDLTLAAKEEVAQGVCRLTLCRPDGGELPAWEPGAHVDLVLSADLVRQYSLCGDPADRSTLQVAVLREVDGRGGSAAVHDTLRVGDTVRVRGPRNHFALDEAARYIFVAGGIGITPLLPMIRQVAGSGRPWSLAYGGRSRASMAFHEDLQAAHPEHVTVHPADEVGLLDELLGWAAVLQAGDLRGRKAASIEPARAAPPRSSSWHPIDVMASTARAGPRRRLWLKRPPTPTSGCASHRSSPPSVSAHRVERDRPEVALLGSSTDSGPVPRSALRGSARWASQ